MIKPGSIEDQKSDLHHVMDERQSNEDQQREEEELRR
jgi:hypothetical protein